MGNSMNQTFNTQSMPVLIETISYAGSAFGVNDLGEQVFINARIVEKCDLEEGMSVMARVLPNYEDKRDQIPWRAMRVEEKTPEVVEEPAAPAMSMQEQAMKNDLMVLDYIMNGYCYTTKQIADALDLDSRTVNNSCTRLFNAGEIAKAEVYSGPNQQRASFLIWSWAARNFAS